jgi:hypothetical protein
MNSVSDGNSVSVENVDGFADYIIIQFNYLFYNNNNNNNNNNKLPSILRVYRMSYQTAQTSLKLKT